MVCVTPFRGQFGGVCTWMGSTYVWEWVPRANIIQALTISRLDNGIALLYDINDNLLTKLQLASKCCHQDFKNTTTSHRSWSNCTAPVHWRIIFKLLLLTWKCVCDKAPSYLQEFIVPYSPARQLCSSNKFLLTVPLTISSFKKTAKTLN